MLVGRERCVHSRWHAFYRAPAVEKTVPSNAGSEASASGVIEPVGDFYAVGISAAVRDLDLVNHFAAFFSARPLAADFCRLP